MAENPIHIVKETDMTGTTTHHVKDTTNTKGNPNYPMKDTADQHRGALALHKENTTMTLGGCVDLKFKDIQIHHRSEIVILGKFPGSQVTVVRRRVTVTISMTRMRIAGALTKKRGGRISTDIHLRRGNQQSSTAAAGISQTFELASIYFN